MNKSHELSKDEIKKCFLSYICYLFSAAYGLIKEPKAYGPIRLLCAAEKLLEILKEINLTDDYLENLLLSINEKKDELLSDGVKMEKFLEEVSLNLAVKLKEQA